MDRLKKLIKELVPRSYIKKEIKEEVKKLLKEELKEEEKDVLNEITRSKKYTKKLVEKLNKILENKEEITEEEYERTEEEVMKEINEENLEEELDNLCERYNKFSESNPAEHISYNKNKKKYVLRDNKEEKTSKELERLIKIRKENLVHKSLIEFTKIVPIRKIIYKGEKFIIYVNENKRPHYDLNHVVNLISNKSQIDKYHECKNKIKLYDIRKNKYGGFYVKEFINQEDFFNIILNSQNDFTKNFKNDVSKILDKLCESGEIIISDNNLVLNENRLIIKTPEEYIEDEYEYEQTYENESLVEFVKIQIREFKKANWLKYLNKPVLYFFITTLKDPTGLNRILCKIGESGDILDRINSIKYEYKCKFYLIGLKLINRSQDEKEFHKLLKSKYPELFVKIKIGGHDKDESYVFDTDLYKSYLEFPDKREFDKIEIKIEEEAEKKMKEYLEGIEERFEYQVLERQSKMLKLENITCEIRKEVALKVNEEHYKLLALKENNRHLEKMKEKEIELEKISPGIKKLELEIRKMELEKRA